MDYRWSAYDFVILYQALESLYQLYSEIKKGIFLLENEKESKIIYGDERHSPLNRFIMRSSLIGSFYLREGIYQDEKKIWSGANRRSGLMIKVVAVKYSHPGFTDIVGFSGVIGQMKEILMHYFPNSKNKEENKLKEQERINQQIENLREIGFTSIQIKKTILLEEITLENLQSLIKEGKIASIELNEN